MNKEDLAILKKYEDRMGTAVRSDYARAVQSRDLDLLLDVWNRHHDTPYRLNKGCSACQLTFLKMLGRWYFNEIKVVEESEPTLIINELQDSATDTAQKADNKTKKAEGDDKVIQRMGRGDHMPVPEEHGGEEPAQQEGCK